MQRVIGEIMARFYRCFPIGLIVDEIEAQFVVSSSAVDPPRAVNPSLGHKRDCEGGLTTEGIVTANRKGGDLVVFPFANACIADRGAWRHSGKQGSDEQEGDSFSHGAGRIHAGNR